ncbi:Werner Syndrome-like exonuclease [Melia azedarach]|uniref:Werner Syndrome-like exonuclease n=1 Tax=Melia azedarach TaxID=155640 RepID=A0ACC1Y960_MELAZ|nr:Werner Syndrome-like exonuclease [Melia azedarach]
MIFQLLPAPSSTPILSPSSSDIKRLDYNHWMIKFGDKYIETTVTSRASDVNHWIHQTLHIHRFRLHKLLVGLDTEWSLPTKTKKHQKVAILQLCVGFRCLIFKLCHKDRMPESLITFLGNKIFTFVGKAVQTDADKLLKDYELNVARIMDVSHMAALKYDDEGLYGMGLRRLALQFLNIEMEKSKRITLSKWDRNELSKEQIQYAAIDAFVSFKLAFKFAVEPKEAAVH